MFAGKSFIVVIFSRGRRNGLGRIQIALAEVLLKFLTAYAGNHREQTGNDKDVNRLSAKLRRFLMHRSPRIMIRRQWVYREFSDRNASQIGVEVNDPVNACRKCCHVSLGHALKKQEFSCIRSDWFKRVVIDLASGPQFLKTPAASL
jgi:hypothetical protein